MTRATRNLRKTLDSVRQSVRHTQQAHRQSVDKHASGIRDCLERSCSSQFDRHPLHRVPGFAQFVGVLVEPVDGIEQALAQHFIAELFDGAD